jgi:RNase P subunit RPR2
VAVVVQPGIDYREKEWEHGLACIDCLRVLREGDRYSERLRALAEGAPVVELVCLECATG